MSAPDRYFFCHLQKTGGVALLRRLAHHFDDSELYPNASDGHPPDSTVSVDHLRARWQARRVEVRVVCGHFPLCTTELLGGGFATFTILRDPVERILSSLRHYRRAHPEEQGLDLSTIYDDPLRHALLYDNHMVRMLALDVDEMTDGMYTNVTADAARLDRAIERLDRMEVVGIQEHYDDFCDRLAHTFGWDLGDPVVSNVTEPEPAPPGLRERIEADNVYDRALHDHARVSLGLPAVR